jgi:hypothetical protein
MALLPQGVDSQGSPVVVDTLLCGIPSQVVSSEFVEHDKADFPEALSLGPTPIGVGLLLKEVPSIESDGVFVAANRLVNGAIPLKLVTEGYAFAKLVDIQLVRGFAIEVVTITLASNEQPFLASSRGLHNPPQGMHQYVEPVRRSLRIGFWPKEFSERIPRYRSPFPYEKYLEQSQRASPAEHVRCN